MDGVWLTFWLTNAPDIGDISTLPMLGMPGRVTATTRRNLIGTGCKGGLLPGEGHGADGGSERAGQGMGRCGAPVRVP